MRLLVVFISIQLGVLGHGSKFIEEEEDNYVPSKCQAGSDRPSWAKGHDVALWENWRRKSPHGRSCDDATADKLSSEQVEEQQSMFASQEAHRKEFADAKALWATSGFSIGQHERFLFFMSHPRKLHKFPQCLHLGLVHQLMNLECELSISVLLKRTLLPFPLVEDDIFSGCHTRFLRFGSIVDLSNFPVDESQPWMKANESFIVTMDPSSQVPPGRSLSPFVGIGRDGKERQSSFCVEYAW
jgi:hypothetical protein